MSGISRRRRTLFLLLGVVAVLPLGGCQSDTKPASAPSVATRPEPSPNFEIKPVLREFLKNLPPDWHLVSARDVASAKPVVVDVRQPDEYAKGFIEGAVNIPLRELAISLQALPSTDKNTVVVCDTGHRSAIGMAVLQMLGYKNARTLEGGIQAWQQAKLAVVTAPVPRRATGQAPNVDARLQAVLDYYLLHELPFNWGALDGPDLTFDQGRKSSAELEPNPDSFEQGHSFLTDVDELADLTNAQRSTTKLSEAINLPLRSLPDVLDRVPIRENISQFCMNADRFQVEPTLLRFTTVSTSSHRARLGMMSMQLLGFHFVNALQGGLDAWIAAN